MSKSLECHGSLYSLSWQNQKRRLISDSRAEGENLDQGGLSSQPARVSTDLNTAKHQKSLGSWRYLLVWGCEGHPDVLAVPEIQNLGILKEWGRGSKNVRGWNSHQVSRKWMIALLKINTSNVSYSPEFLDWDLCYCTQGGQIDILKLSSFVKITKAVEWGASNDVTTGI